MNRPTAELHLWALVWAAREGTWEVSPLKFSQPEPSWSPPPSVGFTFSVLVILWMTPYWSKITECSGGDASLFFTRNAKLTFYWCYIYEERSLAGECQKEWCERGPLVRAACLYPLSFHTRIHRFFLLYCETVVQNLQYWCASCYTVHVRGGRVMWNWNIYNVSSNIQMTAMRGERESYSKNRQ